MIILLLSAILCFISLILYSVNTLLREAFSDPNWLNDINREEPLLTQRELQEMENTEFTYGHNIKHKYEEE